MVMSGGGFRFGMYLGMYQAACDAGQKPDVLLAGCGGAIAAALIHCIPQHQDRIAWLASQEMYQFWTGIHPSAQNNLIDVLTQWLMRRVNRKPCTRIPDLFNDYLFHAPQLNLPFQTHIEPREAQPDIVVIGGRLLFGNGEFATSRTIKRGSRKLFEKTVFGSAPALTALNGFASGDWCADSAIAPQVKADHNMPLDEAVKISVMDMFYFAPWRYQDNFYLGGVVDLFPIEVAKRLAKQVIFERKSDVDHCFINPAWRSVLGIDGRKRQRAVYADPRVTTWIDTRNLSFSLKSNGIGKKIDWRRKAVVLAPPTTYEEYVRNIGAQVAYGYSQAIKSEHLQ